MESIIGLRRRKSCDWELRFSANQVAVLNNTLTDLNKAKEELAKTKADLIVTEETALLQEMGIYDYRHPMEDAAAYQSALHVIRTEIKAFNKHWESAILADRSWAVNGSLPQGRRLMEETSKLMLRAFNAEADSLVRDIKPYTLDSAAARLRKTAEVIARLGKTMNIQISHAYLNLRLEELELACDWQNRRATEKELEREARERQREERKAQAELERERERLEKERRHYENALNALRAKGDDEAAERMAQQIADVDKAIGDVDYRAANIRAGYVYVISNVGAFGPAMVKIGMTRRIDPMDRVNELGDASVPFRFDVHALFFSKDAVGIETEMHRRLADKRVNRINLRREFFYCTPAEAKSHLADLAGELLEYVDDPEALEFRQSQHAAQMEISV